MSISSLLAPALGADGPRSVLVAIAPEAVVLAVLLVLLTAGCIVALVVEVRRDGYGLDRPRPLSPEFPWQTTGPARRRRTLQPRGSWSFLRVSRTAHR